MNGLKNPKAGDKVWYHTFAAVILTADDSITVRICESCEVRELRPQELLYRRYELIGAEDCDC